jgi:hypothetical protein
MIHLVGDSGLPTRKTRFREALLQSMSAKGTKHNPEKA